MVEKKEIYKDIKIPESLYKRIENRLSKTSFKTVSEYVSYLVREVLNNIEEEEKTKGGIIIPDTAKEKPIEGEVIAVGDGKLLDNGKKIPLEVKKGDRVLFGKYAGTEVKIEGEEFLIMREDDVIAIVEK